MATVYKRQRSINIRTHEHNVNMQYNRFPNKLEHKYKTGQYKGQSCFLVGGGESLKGFDFNMLLGHFTIAINKAFEFCSADIAYCEHKYVKDVWSGVYGETSRLKWVHYLGIKCTMVPISAVDTKMDLSVYAIRRNPDLSSHFSLCLDHGLHGGNNSGYAAIELAACLGFSPIYLLGYDMYGTHFHSGYKNGHADASNYISSFSKALPKLSSAGIKVINLNPISALKCFEFGDINKVLNVVEHANV